MKKITIITYIILAVNMGLFCQNTAKNESKELSKQEMEALKQFISFCKIQVELEDGSQYSTGYSLMFIEALEISAYAVNKSYLKNELDKVLIETAKRDKFLNYLGINFSSYTNLFFFIRPPESDSRFATRISSKDAEILTNCILNKYSMPIKKEKTEGNNTISGDVIIVVIIGNKVNFREMPNTTGKVIFQLNSGDICILLEKGPLEKINDNTDFWYKIVYNEKIGWVFGAFTSLKSNENE